MKFPKKMRYLAQTYQSNSTEVEIDDFRDRHKNYQITDNKTTFTKRELKNGKKRISVKKGASKRLAIPKGPDKEKARKEEEKKSATRYEIARNIKAVEIKDFEKEKENNAYLPFVKKKKYRVWTRNPPKPKDKEEKPRWQDAYHEFKKYKKIVDLAMTMLENEGASNAEQLAEMRKEFMGYNQEERKQFIKNVNSVLL